MIGKKELFSLCVLCAGVLFLPMIQNAANAAEDAHFFSEVHGRVDEICRSELSPGHIQRGEGLPFASFKDDVLCLIGELNKENVKTALKIIKTHKINNIFVWSGGGNADSSLDLAEEIRRRDMDVYVFYRCGSSCANYIFMAGARKHVLPGSIVSWHGAPIADSESPLTLKKLWEKHKKFFAEIGVNDEITRLPPACNVEGNTAFLSEVENGKHPNWTYRRDVLEGYFNIRGIVDMWEEPLEEGQSEEDPRVSIADKPKIFLFHACK